MSAYPEHRSHVIDVTSIGGGHGQSNLMWALGEGVYSGGRVFSKKRLAAVVTMFDDGGNTGTLRRFYGTSPGGDLRMNLSPLAPDDRETEVNLLNGYRFRDDRDQLARYTISSLVQRAYEFLYDTPYKRDVAFRRTFGMERDAFEANPEKYPDLAELMTFRFEDKGLSVENCNMGNLMLAALELKHGNLNSALSQFSRILGLEGLVIPVTFDKEVLLSARLNNGIVINGESNVGNHEKSAEFDPRVSLDQVILKDPKTQEEKIVEPNTDALDAIIRSKFRIIGPGSWQTSILPTLKVNGVIPAFEEARERGRKTFIILNPMNQEIHVTGASTHLKDLKRHGFDLELLSDIILSKNGIPSYGIQRYKDFGQSHIDADQEACRDLVPHARIHGLDHILHYDRLTGQVTHDYAAVGNFFAKQFFESK